MQKESALSFHFRVSSKFGEAKNTKYDSRINNSNVLLMPKLSLTCYYCQSCLVLMTSTLYFLCLSLCVYEPKTVCFDGKKTTFLY